jgi:hypothetical protein
LQELFTRNCCGFGTQIPFLLKFTLREYQHIGLDWLVGLYSRGLNGILADEMVRLRNARHVSCGCDPSGRVCTPDATFH